MAMFKAGNAFSKKQQAPTAAPAPAPAASRRPLGGSKLPSMSRSAAPAVAPTTTRGVPTDNYGNLYVGNRRRQSAPVAPNSAAQAAAVNQFNQSQQGAMNRANSVAQFNQGQQAAMQRFNAQPKAPTMSPQVAQQMSAMGPKMPAMAKGGMTKKTGYAKGGAVMCGASMPPAQKRKK